MAADRIKVSTNEMNQTIGRYESARNTMQQAFTALDSAKQHIDRCCDGPAKAIYMAKWANISINIHRSNDAIDATINSLRNVINTMTETEENVGSKATSLDVGTTPPMF